MNILDETLVREIPDYRGETVTYEVPITAYPTSSGVMIINSPGSGELKDGRQDRWMKLGRHLQERGIATLVTYNAPRPDFQVQLPWEPYSHQGASWNQLLVDSLSHVTDFCLEHAQDLCGTAGPEIGMAGFSSGGSAVGAVAWRYPQVKRILLLSTYDSVGDAFYIGIEEFPGDIYIAFGGQDPMAGLLAYVLQSGPLSARSLHIREVPDCNHRFSGSTNSRVLSNAFLWAFHAFPDFPSAEGGLQLYE